jgi:hypothetical protein
MRENGATGDCKAKASHGALSGLEPEHAENLGEARRGATFYATTAAAAPALGAGKAWDGLAPHGHHPTGGASMVPHSCQEPSGQLRRCGSTCPQRRHGASLALRGRTGSIFI